MANILPPDYSATAGIPQQWEDTISATPEGFIVGDEPAVVTEDLLVAASQNIPARTPVGFNGSGNLVPAVSGTTQAIGMTVAAVVTDASSSLRGAAIYRAGVFNPAMVNWPVSYDTDAKKIAAVRGAPTPTNIIMRPVKSASVVLP